MRPVNCLMMGLAVLIGETLAYGTLYLFPSLLGFITAFTLTGASMIANDYWDRSIDAINAPERPLVSGLISIRLALSYTIILMIIGLYSALLNNVLSLLIAAVSLTISLLYSYRGKRLGFIGNVMVSGVVAIPLLYGGFLYEAVNLSLYEMRSLLFFDFMIFLAIMGREVTKGIADIEGDRIQGVRTVAVCFGAKIAAGVAVVFYLSAVALSVLLWFLSWASMLYLYIITIPDVGFVASSFILLRDNSKEGAIRVKRMVLIWMGIVLCAFFAEALS